MATVTLEEMANTLSTIEEVTQQLQKTEPLVTEFLSNDSTIKFQLDADWAHGIDAMDTTDLVGARITVNGVERPLTKEAALQAGANFGIPAAYVKKIPARLTEGLLNYHYGNGMGSKEYHLLSVGDKAVAFTRPTLKPFSNLALLENTVEAIQERQGGDVPIFADYKFHNSLQHTNIRLIVPTEQRVIHGAKMTDVPDNADDVWLAGIHISNSVMGTSQTNLEAYLFRYWCTNGCTTTMPDVKAWSRRVNGQNDDVYTWAREQVDAIFDGLTDRFNEVQALTGLHVGTLTRDILEQIYRDWSVPVSQRERIGDLLLGAEELTMYTIMNAITQVANDEELKDARRDVLMRIAGSFPTETFNTVKEQVWAEGHEADPSALNPYTIREVVA